MMTETTTAAGDDGDEHDEIDDERYDVQRVALDVLMHCVKVTCEGLMQAIADAPHVANDDADDAGPRIDTLLLAVVAEIRLTRSDAIFRKLPARRY